MKNLLLLLILLPVVCWGQKKDSLPLTKENGLTAVATNIVLGLPEPYSFWATPTNRTNQFIITQSPKQDTIPVIMLVCDTSGRPYSSMKYVTKGITEINDGQGVWWQFGYEVRERLPIEINPNVRYWPSLDAISQPIYLDQNKKPLPKSIVVWMSKEITQR